MRVTAVKRTERRDRFYVLRDDGTEASWAVASAPGLPHDLHHLVVESALGLRRGFWGLVAGGMEPGHVRAVSDQLERDRARGADDGLDELMQAEAAVYELLRDGPEDAGGRLAALAARLAGAGVAPLTVSPEVVTAVRAEVDRLTDDWERLEPGKALTLRLPET